MQMWGDSWKKCLRQSADAAYLYFFLKAHQTPSFVDDNDDDDDDFKYRQVRIISPGWNVLQLSSRPITNVQLKEIEYIPIFLSLSNLLHNNRSKSCFSDCSGVTQDHGKAMG